MMDISLIPANELGTGLIALLFKSNKSLWKQFYDIIEVN